MQRKFFNHIQYLEFELLSDIPQIHHAVFLRHGGCSEGAFASLNTSFLVGDNTEHVLANCELIKKVLKHEIPNWKNLVRGQGNHGQSIAVVNKNSTPVIEVDGLMTNTKGISLMMTHADCQVALFYDPKNHVAANIHSGWRGSVANIYREAVHHMQNVFGSNPSDILVCITPSIGPDEAEFIHYQSELPEGFWPFQVRSTYFDFWAISEYQLQLVGILPHHIEIARLSTYANAHDFYSYRRDKVTGRHATCITLI